MEHLSWLTLGLIFLCGIGLVLPLLLGGVFYLSRLYSNRIRGVAEEQGWRYKAGSNGLLGGVLPNGQPWQIRLTFVEGYRYIWEAPLKTNQTGVWIAARGLGRFHLTWFSGLTPYPDVGPAELQQRYFLAATTREPLQRVLTPQVVRLLLNWPRRGWNIERSLKISLRPNRLRISTDINDTSTHLAQLVELGAALHKALDS
ncbi:MAG: hypothetical protein HC875_25145 [Anaerolineales bacterium]|nr:hypothetical protein [Anaerolineales bacterium]